MFGIPCETVKEVNKMPYSLTVSDTDADRHTIKCKNKNELFGWISKFMDDLDAEAPSAINIQVINEGEAK